MFGQFKSIVDCPKCEYECIQLDSFLMCSLPSGNDNVKKLEILYLKDHLQATTITICYEVSWGWKMSDILKDLRKKLDISQD